MCVYVCVCKCKSMWLWGLQRDGCLDGETVRGRPQKHRIGDVVRARLSTKHTDTRNTFEDRSENTDAHSPCSVCGPGRTGAGWWPWPRWIWWGWNRRTRCARQCHCDQTSSALPTPYSWSEHKPTLYSLNFMTFIVSVETDVKMFIIAQTHENSYILTDPHHRCVCNFNKYSQTMLPPLHWRNHIQRHIKTANKQTYDHVMLLG